MYYAQKCNKCTWSYTSNNAATGGQTMPWYLPANHSKVSGYPLSSRRQAQLADFILRIVCLGDCRVVTRDGCDNRDYYIGSINNSLFMFTDQVSPFLLLHNTHTAFSTKLRILVEVQYNLRPPILSVWTVSIFLIFIFSGEKGYSSEILLKETPKCFWKLLPYTILIKLG